MATTDKNGHSAARDTVHAAQGLGVIALTYNWLAEFVNMLASTFMAGEGNMLPLLFGFHDMFGAVFPWPFFWPFWYCIFLGFITYVVIRWVCERKWVAVTVSIKHCWQVNPFGVIFCIIKMVTLWVLVIVCRWRYYIICVPIWVCFLIWIWRWFM